MKFDFRIKKDTLDEYLDELQGRVDNTNLREHYLELMAADIVDIVDEVIPTMNPNLICSGQNPQFWNTVHEADKSSLTILYTGFTGEGMGEPEDIEVWWEFGKYGKGGYNDILGRDYAYYQEFGVDKFYKKKDYKARTFEGHHYLETGIEDSEDVVEYWAGEYLQKILYGR